MIILALDTTSPSGSVALACDGQVMAVRVGRASQPHAERLPADLLDLLASHGLKVRDVDLFAVAAGPGSFTGLRIGIATIQGLAFANERPVVSVSALEALASDAVSPEGTRQLVAAWIDAQRNEVYAALYAPSAGTTGPTRGRPVEGVDGLLEVDGPIVAHPNDVLDRWLPFIGSRAIQFVGDGAVRYKSAVRLRVGETACVVDLVPALAPAVALIAGWRAARGLAIAPHAVRPMYVRRPDAELARERREPETA